MNRVLRIAPWSTSAGPGDEADDERLVAGLRAREPWSAPALVARCGGQVRRVLVRVLGADDDEGGDVLQEVFIRAWKGIGGLSDPRALGPWITRIAVFTAREAIRRRRRRRWLRLVDELPEPAVAWASPEMREAARAVYRIFDSMPVDERIPFALRMLDGLELEATALACGMSVATVRRRLARAERRFFKLARDYEALAPWLPTESR